MKKRLLILSLALLLLLGGCVAGPEPTESESAADSTAAVTETTQAAETDPLQPPETISLVCAGKPQFTIVSLGDEFVSAAENLQALLKSKTGVSFTMRKFDEDPSAAGKIYVGSNYNELTNPETPARYGSYGVVWQNGNLYVCGDRADDVRQCVSVFMASISAEYVTTHENGKITVTIPVSLMFLKEREQGSSGIVLGSSVGSYRIVYAENATDIEQYFATVLRDRIANETGYRLTVVTDGEAAADREIVLGNTSREGSAAFYAADPEAGEYAIVGKGNSLYVGWGSILCLNELLAGFDQIYDKESVRITATVTDTFRLQKTEPTDVRVMTSNVQYVEWDTKGKDHELRMRMTAEYYSLYHPDFIGLQEANSTMRQALTPYLDECYSWVDFSPYTTELAKIDFFPVLYNSQEWRVLEAGCGDWEDTEGRPWGYVWVKFCRTDDATDIFWLLNLHYMPGDFTYGDRYRNGIAEEINAKVTEIVRSDPAARIAITGDYNSFRTDETFTLMYENGYLESSQLLTEDTNVTSAQYASCIDHISVTTDNTEVVCHRNITAFASEYMSDHTYRFSDLRRKQTAA